MRGKYYGSNRKGASAKPGEHRLHHYRASATTASSGLVKKGAAVTNIGTQTVSGADAEAVATSSTTAVNAVGTKLNALLAQLRAAGVIES